MVIPQLYPYLSHHYAVDSIEEQYGNYSNRWIFRQLIPQRGSMSPETAKRMQNRTLLLNAAQSEDIMAGWLAAPHKRIFSQFAASCLVCRKGWNQ